MLEWIGGRSELLHIAIPLFGLVFLLLVPRYTDPHRSWNYLVPGFTCLFGTRLVIGLENGTIVSFPRVLGMGLGVSLLIGFVVFTGLALVTAWNGRTV